MSESSMDFSIFMSKNNFLTFLSTIFEFCLNWICWLFCIFLGTWKKSDIFTALEFWKTSHFNFSRNLEKNLTFLPVNLKQTVNRNKNVPLYYTEVAGPCGSNLSDLDGESYELPLKYFQSVSDDVMQYGFVLEYILTQSQARVNSERFSKIKIECSKVGCLFRKVAGSLLSHLEFGPNDLRKDALNSRVIWSFLSVKKFWKNSKIFVQKSIFSEKGVILS